MAFKHGDELASKLRDMTDDKLIKRWAKHAKNIDKATKKGFLDRTKMDVVTSPLGGDYYEFSIIDRKHPKNPQAVLTKPLEVAFEDLFDKKRAKAIAKYLIDSIKTERKRIDSIVRAQKKIN